MCILREIKLGRKGLVLLTLVALQVVAQGQELQNYKIKVGSPAPGIRVLKWLKGEPIESFGKERMYIMEFGSLKCAPCRASIPHLTEIATKYENHISVISVFVLGNGGYPPKDTVNTSYVALIESFVNEMGEKIGYDVVVDLPNHYMYKEWLKAGESRGIPKAFIIDKKGMILWIGHPFKLSEAVEDIMENR